MLPVLRLFAGVIECLMSYESCVSGEMAIVATRLRKLITNYDRVKRLRFIVSLVRVVKLFDYERRIR